MDTPEFNFEEIDASAYDKHQEFIDRVEPLIEQIIEICNEINIPYSMMFQTAFNIQNVSEASVFTTCDTKSKVLMSRIAMAIIAGNPANTEEEIGIAMHAAVHTIVASRQMESAIVPSESPVEGAVSPREFLDRLDGLTDEDREFYG